MANAKRFYEYQEEKMVRSGDVLRHPEIQRDSPGAKRWGNKCGEFSPAKASLGVLILVKRDDGGKGYYAIDGATRAEICNADPKWGPKTLLKAIVLGNGHPPSRQELAEAFLITNTDKNIVGGFTELAMSVEAQRPDALEAAKVVSSLGSKFYGRVGAWKMVKQGYDMQKAASTALSIWDKTHPLPMAVLRAVAVILTDKDQTQQLLKRRSVLRKNSPEDWLLKARHRMLLVVGKREPVGVYVVRTLLGQRGD